MLAVVCKEHPVFEAWKDPARNAGLSMEFDKLEELATQTPGRVTWQEFETFLTGSASAGKVA